MRTTVGELIAELQKSDPKTPVDFQTTYGTHGAVTMNGVERVDQFVGKTTVVLTQSA